MRKVIGIVMGIAMIMTALMTSVSAETSYDYTLLIYMNGSDLESDYQAGTDDLLEMIQGDLPDNVAVIIQTGGTKDWHSNEYGLPAISSSKVQRWRLTDTTIELLENVGQVNMGESETLRSFIDYTMINYSADQYSLIMWNHGAGAVYGYGVDEHYNFDSMTLDEMQTAFEGSVSLRNEKFDLVGFDACLMGSVEVAHILTPFSDYLIGSEELEPGHGWNYTPIINHIGINTDSSPRDLGNAIIDGFKAQAEALGTDDAMTLSLIDLSKIDAVIEALDGLLMRVTQDIQDEAMRNQLLKYRLEAESYGEGSNSGGDVIPDSDMVDIIDYATILNELYPLQAQNLVLAVKESVVRSITSDFKPNASGLSMYIPAKDKGAMEVAPDILDDIAMSKVYDDFIQTVSTIILNSNVSINIDTATTGITESELDEVDVSIEDNGITGDDQYYSFQIDANDLSLVDEIYTVMGKMDDNDDIQYLARDLVDPKAVADNGEVIGETLSYWVQINGHYVAMYFESNDDSGIITYSIPIVLNGQDGDLLVLFNEENPQGEILGVRLVDTDHVNVQNRNLISLKSLDVVDFLFEYDILDRATDSYYYDGWYYYGDTKVGSGLEINWVPLEIGYYAYCFEIVDIYGNITTTDWLSYEYISQAQEVDVVDDVIWDNFEHGDSDLPIVDTDNSLQIEEGVEYDEANPWLRLDIEAPSTWAIPYINTAYNNNLLIQNTSDGYRTDITREVFCELVINMYEEINGKTIAISDPNIFEDTKNLEIVKAYQLGIVNGYGDGKFGPNDLITREQLITMFYRALLLLEPSLNEIEYDALSFDDASDLTYWARIPSRMLVNYELINGVGGNLLAPQNNATVEQSIKLVNGVYEFYWLYLAESEENDN